jgi:hypothetical protein
MAGTLSRSTPSPVTGVVATTWKAGIRGAGAAGAETRVDGAERAGVGARVGRRTGAGRGAVTVTSGSVSATCPQAACGSASGNIKVLNATAPNRRLFLTSSRDAVRPRPPATYTARPHKLPKNTAIFPRCGPVTFWQFGLEHLAMLPPEHTMQRDPHRGTCAKDECFRRP